MASIQPPSIDPGAAVGWGRLQAAMLASKLARSALYVLVHALAAYHLEATAGIPAAATQSLVSLAIMVQFARPLLAWWSDARPVAGWRRKVHGAAGNACFVLACALLFTGAGSTVPAIAVALLAYGAGDALQDVAFDAWLLDAAGADPARKNRGQVVMRLGVACGTVLGYGAGGVLVDAGWDGLVAMLLAACAASAVLGVLVPEPKVGLQGVRAMVAQDHRGLDPRARSRLATLAWSAGLLVAAPFAAGALADVMLEPWLMDRIGAPAPAFYGVELLGGAPRCGP